MNIEPTTHEEMDIYLRTAAAKLHKPAAELMDELGLSGLSTATLMAICMVHNVRSVGGPAAKAYLGCVLDGAFAKTPAEGEKASRRAGIYMEAMARHYDAMVAKARGPVQ